MFVGCWQLIWAVGRTMWVRNPGYCQRIRAETGDVCRSGGGCLQAATGRGEPRAGQPPILALEYARCPAPHAGERTGRHRSRGLSRGCKPKTAKFLKLVNSVAYARFTPTRRASVSIERACCGRDAAPGNGYAASRPVGFAPGGRSP